MSTLGANASSSGLRRSWVTAFLRPANWPTKILSGASSAIRALPCPAALVDLDLAAQVLRELLDAFGPLLVGPAEQLGVIAEEGAQVGLGHLRLGFNRWGSEPVARASRQG